MGTDFRGAPGLASGNSFSPRIIFTNPALVEFAPTLALIDGSKSRDTGNSPINLLRAGLLMGKITASGKYAPSIIGLSGVLHDTSGVTTTMTLPAAIVTEISRRIGTSGTFKIIGPPAAAGTVAIETVTYSAIASATTITITATTADFAAGSIIAANDGTYLPLTPIPNSAGIDVLDMEGTAIDQPLSLFTRKADLIATRIINLTEADASVQTWIKTQLKNVGLFTFDNDR